MFIVYWAIPPQKYIDYAALDESKAILERSKKVAIQFHDTPEQKRKAKEDYHRFCHPETPMQLIFYSEKDGYYKYFASIIERIIENSDIVVHYITSDPNDSVFSKQSAQFKTYYLDEHSLILAFMKADADMMVMTMPDLQQYHLKRSYFRKDMEYVYIYHAMIVGAQTVRKGATEYYDTLFCTGEAHAQQERKLEEFYHWKARNIIECGYPLLDQLINEYSTLDQSVTNKPHKILIAPSYQDDNILDSCLLMILKILFPAGYDITVRPHPQYIKIYPAKLAQLYEDCRQFESDRFRIQSDFGSNDTVYTSDLIITDWSSIAYEFSFATLKPSLFVNTPRKIINQDYQDCEIDDPPEIYLRHAIGQSIAPECIEKELLSLTEELFAHAKDYVTLISEARSRNISNIGHAADIASNYIINRIKRRGSKNGLLG
jgi:YidC/Oxa1 family membrane protein insertase